MLFPHRAVWSRSCLCTPRGTQALLSGYGGQDKSVRKAGAGVKSSTWWSKSTFYTICKTVKILCIFQRYSALKSEEVKTLHQMRPKGHYYREGICAQTEQGDTLQWAQELPPSTNHLPAPCKATLLYFQDAMEGLLPIQPRLSVSTKLSQPQIRSTYLCPQLPSCMETLRSPVDHQQDTPHQDVLCSAPAC